MRQSLNERVALALKVEMLRAGVTTVQLADRAGVSYIWLHRRLKGVIPLSVDDVDLLAGHLGVLPAHLFVDHAALARI